MPEEKSEHHSPVLIVAHPGRIRDGLRALLRAIPEIGTVLQANDSPSASQIIAEYHPDLVLIDSKLVSSDTQSMPKKIKAMSPETRCILLVDNLQQQAIADGTGADTVLLSGFSAWEFMVTVEKLLPQEADRLPKNGQ
jgi:DNA-binding NarL/FixJ family response regulator